MNETLCGSDQLSLPLLWDVDRNTIDPVTYERWLTKRILERERWEDWLILRDNPGKEFILAHAAHLHIDPNARHKTYR